MTSPDPAPRPFQFGLRSIFLLTSAIAVAFGLLHWIDLESLLAYTVPCAIVIAILVRNTGTGKQSEIIVLLIIVLFTLNLVGFNVPGVLFWACLAALFFGGFAADAKTKYRLALAWFVIVYVIGIVMLHLHPPPR